MPCALAKRSEARQDHSMRSVVPIHLHLAERKRYQKNILQEKLHLSHRVKVNHAEIDPNGRDEAQPEHDTPNQPQTL